GMKRQEQTVRQQLREWYYEVPRKRGPKRQALHVETCFPVWLVCGVSWWQGTQLALALDATALGTRFVVLAVSVVYRGWAIPVAWVVLPANTKHAWRREWLRLLRRLRPALPRGWTVLVLTDRGLYAPWLFWRIVRLGWHPFLRINTGGTFRPAGTRCFRPLKSFAPQPGTRWRGRGTAFQKAGRQVECTLVVLVEDRYQDPWVVLTDLPPEASDAAWYGLRAWIEQGFKITKRAGWQWHRTRMTDPERAARLWLDVAVATLVLRRWGARDVPRQHLARCDGVVLGPAADTAGAPPALGERVSPRLGGPVGGLVAPGAVAGGTLDPRTLASGASVGGGKPPTRPDAARGRMRSRGKAVEAVWGKCGHSQHLMNETSPSKGRWGAGGCAPEVPRKRPLHCLGVGLSIHSPM